MSIPGIKPGMTDAVCRVHHKTQQPCGKIIVSPQSDLKVQAGDQVANGELLIVLSAEVKETEKPA